MMASRAYQILVGGKTGKLGALTLLTSRVVHVGSAATSLPIHEGADTAQEDTGMTVFMTVMLCSYLLVFLIGALMLGVVGTGPAAAQFVRSWSLRQTAKEEHR